MEDKAKWFSSNIDEFNSDFNERDEDNEAIGCRLTLTFFGNTVTIRDINCNDFHGAV